MDAEVHESERQAAGQSDRDVARASRRIVVASVFAVGLIAVALMTTIVSHRSAQDAQAQARTLRRDASRVQLAQTYLWREREAMNEYLLTPQDEIRHEVENAHRQFRRVVLSQDRTEKGEGEVVRQTLAGDDAFFGTFKAAGAPRDDASSRRLTQRLNAGETAVLAVLDTLQLLNERAAARSERAARRTSKRGLVAGVIAGVLAVAAGAAFALYGVRLVRRIGRQNEGLRELDRMKDDFVASVSHELRTPLTSIQGYLELVLEGEAGDITGEQRRFLGIVRRNADRLLRVVGDLLFVAQADAGTIALDRSAFDLDAVLAEAVDAARPIAVDKEIELSFEADGLPTLVGDRARIAQVVDNLVSNAVKFTPNGGRVSVRGATEEDAAIVEVADTGMGISPEDQERLFQRFFRTAAAFEQTIPGTGLGLAIVAAIVDAHGGSISVESEVGRGTTFRVSLPLEAERDVA